MKQKRRKTPMHLITIEFFIQGTRYAVCISKRFLFVQEISVFQEDGPIGMKPVKTDIIVTGTPKEEMKCQLQMLKYMVKKYAKKIGQSGSGSA